MTPIEKEIYMVKFAEEISLFSLCGETTTPITWVTPGS